MNTAIETIGTAQMLKDAGIKLEHAEAIANVVVIRRSDLATKTDIAFLKSDIDSLRNLLENKINNLR